MPAPPSLDQKLAAALASREDRLIRRRLPEPSRPSAPPYQNFSSNDYLALSTSPALRAHFLAALAAAPDVLGSGGSRLLVNGTAHAALEKRLAGFFGAPAALLFNSGFDANAGFFACVPQEGDAVVCDEYIHASVHDGVRAGRAAGSQYSFGHNDVLKLRAVLERLMGERAGFREGGRSVFVAVESVYSMDGTMAPLAGIVALLEELFPRGNGYLVVDEAHATGIYGPQGRGVVAMMGLEDKVLARLHTFGKALAATGAVILMNTLLRDYLINYARPLIYTTSLSHANIIAAGCSFDMLEDGTAEKLATQLLDLTTHFLNALRLELATIPSTIVSLPPHLQALSDLPPTPIIPLLTPQPRPLSAFLLERGMNARPITWPTVPKGLGRVRVCLHAGLSKEEVNKFVAAVGEWAHEAVKEAEREERRRRRRLMGKAVDGLLESKL